MSLADVGQLTAAVFAEAARFAPRSPERRAASHLYFALTEPRAKTIAGARNAIASFGTDAVQAAALDLLDRLTAAATATATKGTTA